MMPRRRVRALLLLICLLALDFSGCFVRRRIITRKGANATPVLLTADKQTLIDRLARAYQAIQSFSATVDMVPALGSSEKSKITEYKDVRGYILFRMPADIRIIGLYPVVRNKAFDMVSTGKDFRLYLPSSNRFVIGSNQLIARSPNKIENLRPQHFLEALLVAPMQPGEKPELVNLTDEDNAVYVLHFVRLQPDGCLLYTSDTARSRIAMVARIAGGFRHLAHDHARRRAIGIAHAQIDHVLLRRARPRPHFVDHRKHIRR